MEEQDIYLQYLERKITKYEMQLKGVIYHLNRHKEIMRRLKDAPQPQINTKSFKPVQLNLFGT